MSAKTKAAFNPVGITNIGDPFIRLFGGKYYLYATSSPDGFKVWESDDLQAWSELGLCFEKTDTLWAYKDFWAPEVIEQGGKYIMHYTARRRADDSLRIGVAVADSPRGPFRDIGRPMFDFGYAVIDGHVFVDDDGKKYFYYSKDCSENVYLGRHESHVYGFLLSDDCLSPASEPCLLLRPTEAFEILSGDWRWNEGPFVLKHDNLYYLMYSANFYAGKEYCVSCAVSDRPLCGYVKPDYNPVLTYVEGKVSGPGHNSVFTAKNGELLTAYHVHTDYHAPSGDRQLFIDRLYFDERGRLTISGPSIR